jgi:hypothetical protein
MCTFGDYLRQSFDFLHGNNTHKFVHTTKLETKKFSGLVDTLTETIEKVLLDFRKYLKSKKRSLVDLIDLYQLLKNKYGDEIDEDEFQSHVKECIEKSIRNQYERLRGTDSPGPTELISLCEKLIPVVGDIKKYSHALPKYVSYEALAIELMYNSFAEDFENDKDSFTGKEMFLFCDKLKELNEGVKIHFKEEYVLN